jgi:hypothetical protein
MPLIACLSKELEKPIEKIVDTNADLENSKNNIDATVEYLQNQIQENIAITKAQETLHKMILQFETDRYRRKSIWNVKRYQNDRSNANPKTTPLQHEFPTSLERFVISDQCLSEMHGHLTDMEKTLDKLTQRCKHWDSIFEQYKVSNFQYIDESGILHETPMQFVDSRGQVHQSPLQFIAEYGTVYDDLDYDSKTKKSL